MVNNISIRLAIEDLESQETRNYTETTRKYSVNCCNLEGVKGLKESNNRLEVVINNSMVLQLSGQSCSDDKEFPYRYIRVRARLLWLLKNSGISSAKLFYLFYHSTLAISFNQFYYT
ncbi:uncharacterized protein CIMG_12642 [Coccidioides immitis RS]|uniref:Uncharacterized protein n=1 Tax=Coccidioides immitis (strain RS) TaxID=246410 RepID=A0A0E1S0H4_COCIM|nr:uncharacterized protein CIMG_12642 [Coccidioides immitis RS]EAS37368.2 hypothetical protein CIMG_12642 [Coccidioides immitis RS]